MQIEGLRGISMLVVVIYHIVFRFSAVYLNQESNVIVEAILPGLAVPCFMILSGYFMESPHNGDGFLTGVLKKIIRLWPTYVVSITITYLMLWVFPLPGRDDISLLEYLLNAVMVNGYIGVKYVDGAHWYLTALISAQIVVVFLQKFPKVKWGYVVWILITITLKVAKSIFPGTFIGKILSGMFVLLGCEYSGIFMLGILIRRFQNGAISKRQYLIANVCLVCFIGIMRGLLAIPQVILASLLVILTCINKLPFLEKKVFAFLGGISYATYLVHRNTSYAVMLQLKNKGCAFVSMVGMALIISIVLGFALNMYVEKPIARLATRLSKVTGKGSI